MVGCFEAAKGERRSEIVELILERESTTDVDLNLHNKLVHYFIDEGKLNSLRALLIREAPESQFLDDSPVVNSWRVSNGRYEDAAAKLAKKIGGRAMLDFAATLARPLARQVATSEALIQVSEEKGLAAASEMGHEIAQGNERAQLLLNVVEKHLLPPFPQ